MTVKDTKQRQKVTHTFAIDYTSEIDDFRYFGNFTVKKLSIRDIAALGVRKAQLNGGMHYSSKNPGHGVDEDTDEYNSMIAHLELAVIDAPKWWDFDKISDSAVISKVYKEVISFENSFLRSRRTAVSEGTGSGGDSEKSSGTNSSETNSGRNDSEMVAKKIQSALEP